MTFPNFVMGSSLGPPNSQSLAVKEFCFLARGICGDFFCEITCGHSEIAKPRVRKPRVFINCHPDPSLRPHPVPQDLPLQVSRTMHSFSFPHKEGRVLRIFLGGGKGGWLSGPLRLRVQSRSRTRLRIAATISRFCFALVSKGVLDTIAPLSRG